MQAYSLDLRQRVVEAYENGVETIIEVAERFEVIDSFIKKLLRRKRTTGDDPRRSDIVADNRESCLTKTGNGY